jgi:hypothetical protein
VSRTGKPKTAVAYIGQISEVKMRKLAGKVRAVIKESVPEAKETLKMGIPYYAMNNKMFTSIADYTAHVNLYFNQGVKLSSKRLEGTGKGMRHIKVRSESDIDPEEFSGLLKEAARNALNE